MKFFKIMLLGFKTQLNLPLRFCEKARNEFRSKAEIRTCLGSWKIKVGKDREFFYFHGDEWNKFVKRHDLNHCDCVVFDHRGSFHFRVTIYSPNSCLKDFPSGIIGEYPQVPPTKPTFTRILTAHSGCDYYKNQCRLYLPKKAPWLNNLKGKKKVILKFSGLERREWRADLVLYTQNRVAVGKGWSDFVRTNNIKKGDECKFEIITDASAFGHPQNALIIVVTKK